MDFHTTKNSPVRSFLRLPDVLARIPISRSRWYDGVKKGEFPAPVKISANISAWRSEDIEALIARLGDRGNDVKPKSGAS